MRDDIELRRATLDDLDEVLALWSHYLRVHRDNPAYRLAKRGLERRKETFRRHIEGPGSAVFVLARADGGLDGMVTCFVEENLSYFLPPRFARIQTPYVRPDARRQGNLKRLITAAIRWAREEELMEIRLFTSAHAVMGNAIADELGFEAIEVVRRKPVDWGSPPERQLEE